jgi:anti-sigma factor RsiW
MTCREFIEFLMQYLTGEVDPERRRLFEEHIGECEDCVAYMESYRTAVALGKRAYDDLDAPLPSEVPEQLVRAVIAARKISK